MTEEEYAEISLLLRRGMSLNQAAGTNAKRVQYQRMKKQKEKQAEIQNQMPVPAPNQSATTLTPTPTNDLLSEENLAKRIPSWSGYTSLDKELWRENIRMALTPWKGPHYAQMHQKTMAAFYAEFQEKKRVSFSPDDYKKEVAPLLEDLASPQKIKSYAEHQKELKEKKNENNNGC